MDLAAVNNDGVEGDYIAGSGKVVENPDLLQKCFKKHIIESVSICPQLAVENHNIYVHVGVRKSFGV